MSAPRTAPSSKSWPSTGPGLLYDISSTFAEHSFNIEVGLIDTEGGTATDVFYVTQYGAKLTPDRQHELQAELQQRL